MALDALGLYSPFFQRQRRQPEKKTTTEGVAMGGGGGSRTDAVKGPKHTLPLKLKCLAFGGVRVYVYMCSNTLYIAASHVFDCKY